MDEAKTVTSDSLDLYASQIEDVSSMRDCLLAIDKADPGSARRALHNITVLRVYHQLARIVRYTELMDKLEDKMYNSIELTLQNMDEMDDSTWRSLVVLQEKLQASMIESHKLLQPYLNMEQLAVLEAPPKEDPGQSFTAMILDKESREKLRTSAHQLLDMLGSQEEKEEAEAESTAS